jgi:hypothetical protein
VLQDFQFEVDQEPGGFTAVRLPLTLQLLVGMSIQMLFRRVLAQMVSRPTEQVEGTIVAWQG